MRRQRRFYVESVEPLEDRVALAVAGLATVQHVVSQVPAQVGPALASSAHQVSSANDPPLPTGTWHINANGFQGSLIITSVGPNGRLTRTVYGNQIDGFWDEGALKVIFIREPAGATNYSAVQVYTGYLFQNPHVYTLAGSFEAFAGSGGLAQRNVFGWFAQMTI